MYVSKIEKKQYMLRKETIQETNRCFLRKSRKRHRALRDRIMTSRWLIVSYLFVKIKEV